MKEKIKKIIEKLKEQLSDVVQSVLSILEPPVRGLLEKYPILADVVDKVGAFISWFGKSLEPIFKGGGRKTLGYVILFFTALAFFFVIGFDTDGFKNYLETKIRTETGYEVSIKKLGFSIPPGLKLKGVALSSVADGTELKFSSLKIRPLIFSIFTGKPAVRFNIAENEGGLTIDLSRKLFGGKELGISLASASFPVHSIIGKVKGNSLPIEAMIDAEGEFALNQSSGDGEGDLTILLKGIKLKGGVFGEGLVKKLSPESVECSVKLENKKLESKGCVAVTPLGSIEIKLRTTLAKRLANTPLLGSVVIRKPTGFLASLLEMNQKQKRPDGSYVIPMKGTLKNPRLAI